MPWAKRTSKTVPNLGVRSEPFEINDYSLGMNSFLGNDKFPLKNGASNMWRLAQNARITTLGEYESRKGFDFHSEAAGSTEDATQTSTTGAADMSFNSVTRYAQKLTTGAGGKLHKVDIRLKNDASATGVPIVEIWTDSAGAPSELLTRSSIAPSAITSSYAYLTARFPDAPTITTTTVYWIVVYVQSTGTGSYKWSSTTTATDALVSADSGDTWSSTSYALNFKQYYSTTGGVKGLVRATKSTGTKVTIFAHGTVLYSVDDSTGALTTIKSGLSSSATQYRFEVVNDIVYYVNGHDGLRKLTGANFATDSQVSSTNYTHIKEHKGLMFLVTKDDPNKVIFSNFADYETFTSTDFIYVPSPKTGDPVTALEPLNGYLIIPTVNSKYILFGDDNATFQLQEAQDQNGTYSQETITADYDYIYYLAKDGVRRSNGSESILLSKNVYNDVIDITNKSGACMAVHKGRLYLWYASAGASGNDSCLVWNLNYGTSEGATVESIDTNAYVSRAQNAFNDDALIVASSENGQIHWQELSSNDYTNLGGDIDFELDTHYMTFSSPAVLKAIRYWEPRFGAQSGSYTVSCEYATDLRNNWQTYSSPNLQGSGYVWGDAGTVWGAFTWGTTAELQSQLYVPGEYRRIAIRYKHYATRQPVSFLGHTLVTQTRRIR